MANEVPGTEYYDNDETLEKYDEETIQGLFDISLYYGYLVEKGLFQNGATKEELVSWAAEYKNMSDEDLYKFLDIDKKLIDDRKSL